ncbi:hypothetical protein A5714_15070 [Mycobacterium sp. E2462]|uniref:PucR family transcriptional regulator n=1 Tax=Mycobacterium sp. E2462 TaxID=1834133 RepID=UPI0007FD31A7|nr:helix-turn-helix domain-containing protein [Mycobacterium sp. E2462]OBI13191.1 hypothetical protein A5714_15070 [Mycobacterium sp. E2462]
MDDAAAISDLGAAIKRRSEEISRNMTAAVYAQIDFYKHDSSPSHQSVLDSCRANLDFVLSGLIAEQSTNASSATRTGDERARGGVPLHSLIASHRVSSNEVWQALHSTVGNFVELSREAMLAVAERVGYAQHVYVETGVRAHRQRSLLQAVGDQAEYAGLVEALFRGVALPGRSLWEIAELVRIPRRGPYVVVAMRDDGTGQAPPADIGMRLRALDIYSAWRRVGDSQVGVVCLPTESAREQLLAALNRWATGGAGVSAEFTDLADVPTALHYAQVVVDRANDAEPVVVVGNAALELVALVDPAISRRLAASVLGPLNALPTDERDLLRRIFTAWTTHRGSIPETAAALYCHPNTVRYRLQRIEQLTGRSVRAPTELSELCLAFEIVAKLPALP